jgi:hypothetical protein
MMFRRNVIRCAAVAGREVVSRRSRCTKSLRKVKDFMIASPGFLRLRLARPPGQAGLSPHTRLHAGPPDYRACCSAHQPAPQRMGIPRPRRPRLERRHGQGHSRCSVPSSRPGPARRGRPTGTWSAPGRWPPGSALAATTTTPSSARPTSSCSRSPSRWNSATQDEPCKPPRLLIQPGCPPSAAPGC